MTARRTPLYDEHVALGAKMVPFGGWDMPLVYSGALDEHRAVRSACGLFDVSHMGEVEVRGGGAAAVVGRVTTNDVSRLDDLHAQYSLLCDERGGIIDDLIVYRLAADRFFLVVNAAHAEADVAWMRRHVPAEVVLEDQSASWALLALQGPAAVAALGAAVDRPLDQLKSFGIMDGHVDDVPVRIARTGYTGEDGFEVFVPGSRAVDAWRRLLACTRAVGGMAAGLAARDTLRLEAGLLLHGSDMDVTTTPWEAGLGWVVKGRDFIGRDALAASRERPAKHLVGFVMDEPGVPRHGQAIFLGDRRAGEVTSGTKSPTLDSFIGLAYVNEGGIGPGTPLGVEMRGRRLRAHVVARPFYRRRK
jgi:aminomethyltransferase